MTFGREIRAERGRWGISQARLAEALGIQRNTLVEIELGRVPISTAYLNEVLRTIEALAGVSRQDETTVSRQ